MSILTIAVSEIPRDESFQAWAMGRCLFGRQSIGPNAVYSNGLGLNSSFTFRAHALQDPPHGDRMSTNQ